MAVYCISPAASCKPPAISCLSAVVSCKLTFPTLLLAFGCLQIDRDLRQRAAGLQQTAASWLSLNVRRSPVNRYLQQTQGGEPFRIAGLQLAAGSGSSWSRRRPPGKDCLQTTRPCLQLIGGPQGLATTGKDGPQTQGRAREFRPALAKAVSPLREGASAP